MELADATVGHLLADLETGTLSRDIKTSPVRPIAFAPLIHFSQVLKLGDTVSEWFSVFFCRPPKQQITDADELAQYRLRKRKEFEDTVRRVRWNQSKWVQYAQWEESQKDFPRAR